MFADFYIFFPYRYQAFSFQTAEAAIYRNMSIVKPGKSCSCSVSISRRLRGSSARITKINAVKCLNFDF